MQHAIDCTNKTMRWSEPGPERGVVGDNGLNSPLTAAPTIKNHSVTYFNGYLYCFGGYDGRRNHMTLLLYSIAEERWIRPHHLAGNHHHHHHHVVVPSSSSPNNNNNNGGNSSPTGRTSEGGGLVMNNNNTGNGTINNANNNGDGSNNPGPVGAGGIVHHPVHNHPHHHHHHPGLHHHHHGYFGAGGPNDPSSSSGAILVQGTPPPGRNGHSATLAEDPDDPDNARIIIIGGWLGTGPLAASDMHVLDVRGRHLRWHQPAVKGRPPGPCNMHSADYVRASKEVYVFRGGNGREYLNDLHALCIDTLKWRRVETKGAIPQQRANHSSAMLEETNELFIFGGWNGTERLNDVHILDTATSTWTCPRVGGVLPHPRAGMTLTALRGKLFLFGGSGTSAKCFHDLQILDREGMAWLDVTNDENSSSGAGGGGGGAAGGGGGSNAAGSSGSSVGSGSALPVVANASRHRYDDMNHHNHHLNLHAGNEQQDDAGMRFRFGGSNSLYDYNNSNDPQQLQQQQQQQQMQQIMQSSQEGAAASSNPHLQNRLGTTFTACPAGDWRSRDSMAARGGPRLHQQSTSSSQAAGGEQQPLHNHHQPQQVHFAAAHHHYHHHHHQQHCSANPNDEDTVPVVTVHGRGPGRRAGHTATAVHRKIYIFGGSCGSDYLNDFFVLDTDPPPVATVTEPNSIQLLERRLKHFFNDEEFSDVKFLVQGRAVYGHKMVLSMVSDCFRAMFTTGFKESAACQIEIPDCSYDAFVSVMEYIYTGQLPAQLLDLQQQQQQAQQQQQRHYQTPPSPLGGDPMADHHHFHNSSASSGSVSSAGGASSSSCFLVSSSFPRVVEMLELADRFFLDHLKQICETLLQHSVQSDTVEYLLQVAQKTNAHQLRTCCEHFLRNQVVQQGTTATATVAASSVGSTASAATSTS